MDDGDNTYRRQSEGRKPDVLACIIALVAALALASSLAFGFGIMQDGELQAYATIYPAGENAQVDDQASADDADDGSDADAEETEILDDEGAPLSSGLGGGEPISGSVGFWPIAIVGIAAVALFFLVLMRRLNSNINDMSSMFK